jgi:hypothetical protein
VKNLIQQLTRRAISEVCYRICNQLEQHTDRRTTGTIIVAGEAVAVSWMLDWKRALQEDNDSLPTSIANALGAFSAEEWHEVMSHASFAESLMTGIDRPEWEHLRCKPID